jgi:hypothetical protein
LVSGTAIHIPIGFGQGHERNAIQLDAAFKAIQGGAIDLRTIPLIRDAIYNCQL